ncbi:MAG: TMEM175 family protein [Planctomycetota bacterium]
MIREHLFHKRAPADPLFRWRGGEVSRLEAFSDAVFAVTLTLLVVSGTPPKTFDDLWLTFRDLPVFLVSFAMLMMAWYYHYQYFRRYGLEDFTTNLLNTGFLFVVVFFAYPLKFLATFLWYLIVDYDAMRMMFQSATSVNPQFTALEERSLMMYLYAGGIIGVFGLLALMVGRALSQKEVLELDKLEIYLTRTSLIHHLITVGVAVGSIVILMTGAEPGIAGIFYFLLGPLHGVTGWKRGVHADKIHKQLVAEAKAAAA